MAHKNIFFTNGMVGTLGGVRPTGKTVQLTEEYANGFDVNFETGESSSFVRRRVVLSDGPAHVELTVYS